MSFNKCDKRREETLKSLKAVFDELGRIDFKDYLDLGCGKGELTLLVADIADADKCYGVDISQKSIEACRREGIEAHLCDLNKEELPFADGSFDLITAFEVIEHLVNTDNLISEAWRVLKEEKIFILTTPNLASWVNRLLLLFGFLPFHYRVSPKRTCEKRPLQSSSGRVAHVRLYTLKTLRKHIESYGFRIIKVSGIDMGYTTSNPLIRFFNWFLSKRKSLAGGLLIVAKKPSQDQREKS